MLFVKTKDGVAIKYPISLNYLYKEYLEPNGYTKNDNYLEFLAQKGYYPVKSVPAPKSTYANIVKGELPVFKKGEWIEKYTVTPKTPKQLENDREIVSESVRSGRNALLMESDWTQVPDSPLDEVKKQDWAAYRQELRNITKQSGFPFDVQWPEKPSS